MTEKKIIRVSKPVAGSQYPPMVEYVDRVFEVGSAAPEGHEGRPYTVQIADEIPRIDMGQRIEDPAPNRMQSPDTHKRSRAKKG